MSTLIYRIEKPFEGRPIGIGAYQCGGFSDVEKLELAHQSHETHPSMQNDFEWNYSNFWNERHCACPTLASLKQWFNRWVSRLDRESFVIVEYEVTDCIVGNSGRQVVFHPTDIINKTILS